MFISFHFFLFKGCNGITHTENTTFGYRDWYHNTGFVKSPDYPSNYPHNQLCRWSIQVAPGFRILATVKQADLAHAAQSGGLGDTLHLDDGISAKTSIEHSAPWEFLSNSSLVRIIFITDSANAGKGFYIHYERGMYDMPLHYDYGTDIYPANSAGCPRSPQLGTFRGKGVCALSDRNSIYCFS